MTRRLASDRGQATVITVLFLTVLLGMAAMAIDVGTWYQAKRKLQAKADAAALAGAQALPESTASAQATAIDYAQQNSGVLAASGIAFSSDIVPNDTIKVNMSEKAPGFFSQVLGIGSVDLNVKAAARSDTISKARYAAPIAVDIKHPDLSGSGCPCFGQQTTLDLKKTGPGAFRLLNLDGSSGGINPHTLEEWMMSGFDGWMPVDKDYYSDPGAKFNSMQDALAARTGSELLFPIYDAVQGQGSNLTYHVIGWVGFHMTGYDARGSSGILYGWFTRVVWQGIQVERGSTESDFGVRAIQLVQ